MKKYIASCGLNCETCDAYIATVNQDQALREKTARLWTQLNQVTITAEMINCTGCRMQGVKTPYCEGLCPIRKCVADKGFHTCGDCAARQDCQTLGQVTNNNYEALKNLTDLKEAGLEE